MLLVIGSPPAVLEPRCQRRDCICHTHEECLQRLTKGDSLDFLLDPDPECGFCISLFGLDGSLGCSPLTHARSFEAALLVQQYAGDLARKALHAWQHGRRACLCFPADQMPVCDRLSSLRGISMLSGNGSTMLWHGEEGVRQIFVSLY